MAYKQDNGIGIRAIRRLLFMFFTLAIVLFVVWFFVRRSGYAADQSQLPLILTAAGSVLGTILSAVFFAVTKKKKAEI